MARSASLLPLLAVAGALTGCATLTGDAPVLGERAVAYEAGSTDPGVYAFSDTTSMSIQAGAMGTLRVLSAQSGIVEIAVGAAESGLQATVRVLEYDGRFENPNQGAVRADENDITGGWTVRLSPRGRLEVVDTPTVTRQGREIVGGESFIRPLFVHLPGTAAESGARWVDTVSATEAGEGTVTRARSVIASTLVGDSVVDGRRLAVIRTESVTTIEIEGESGGVEIVQRMSGTLRGTVLWDLGGAMLVEREESGELEGTLELPGMGFGGMPVEARMKRTMSLRP